MITISIRTIIIYVVLMITMRLMGKRQLGELDLTELVITFMLSEIASLPITNTEIPMLHAIVPILILMAFEIITSTLALKSSLFKKIFASSPSVIISKGIMNISEMRKVRISLDELVSQVRQNGIYDLDEVDYAILEENGKMSIIPKSLYRTPSIKDLSLPDDRSGIGHILISDGKSNRHNLRMLGHDEGWLQRKLECYKLNKKDVFCMTLDDSGKIFITTQDGKPIKIHEKDRGSISNCN